MLNAMDPVNAARLSFNPYVLPRSTGLQVRVFFIFQYHYFTQLTPLAKKSATNHFVV
jgi:hypothetical protein